MRLRYKIKIYNKVATRDAYGGYDNKYELVDEVFADIVKKKGREIETSRSLIAKRYVTFLIRWRNDFTESSIIKFTDERGTNDYNIKSIKQDYTGQYKMYLLVKAEMTKNVIHDIFVDTGDFIILENGSYILQENNYKINIE